MLIDGEKYACDACVRGHRVSNCNHYERPLTHINKKGRPVSQCPHCRGLRKARASHVKCECGDKPHSKSNCTSPDKAGFKRSKPQCCCSHGSPCTCALKKEHLGVLGDKKNAPGLQRSRSHTDTNKPLPMFPGETSMPMFQNGRHQPMHHRNQAGHECGLPYKIPRPHSIHGNTLAQSSADNLPLLSGPYNMLIHESRMARSEHGSPALPPKIDLLNQLPQLDLTYGALNTDIASSVSSPVPDDMGGSGGGYPAYMPGMDDQPMSAMSGPPVDWGSMDLPLGGANLPVDYNQARSYTSYDQPPTSHPGLHQTGSSGDVSEAEDYMGNVHSPAMYCGSPYPGGTTSAPEPNPVMGQYNMSSDSLVSMTPPPSSVPMGGSLTAASAMDQYMAAGMGSPRAYSDYGASPKLEQDHHFGSPALTIHDMQRPGRGPSPPSFRPTSDPSWAGSFVPEEAAFMPTSAPFHQQQQAAWTC